MNKATPIEMRKALQVVDALKKAGVLFVPVPILDSNDKDLLLGILEKRLDIIEGMHTEIAEKESATIGITTNKPLGCGGELAPIPYVKVDNK